MWRALLDGRWPQDDQLPLRHDLLDPLDGDEQTPTPQQAATDFKKLRFERTVKAQTVDGADPSPGRGDPEPLAAM